MCGVLGGQEQHCLRDMIRLRDPAERRYPRNALLQCGKCSRVGRRATAHAVQDDQHDPAREVAGDYSLRPHAVPIRICLEGRQIDDGEIRDESGEIIGASKIARDISQRKANEARLADLQERLMRLLDAPG